MADITSSVNWDNPSWYVVNVDDSNNKVPLVVYEASANADTSYYDYTNKIINILPPIASFSKTNTINSAGNLELNHYYCRGTYFDFGSANENDHSTYFKLHNKSGTTFAIIQGGVGSTSFVYGEMIIIAIIHTANDIYFGGLISYNNNSSGSNISNEPMVAATLNHKGSGYLSAANVNINVSNANQSYIDADNLYRALLNIAKPLDPNDPDSGAPSGPGGGGDPDDIGGDDNEDDGLPTISGMSTGLYTVYNPSLDQLKNLGQFLWSDSFDVNAFKKLFTDPFDVIMGLSIIPITPHVSGSQNIVFGNVDSGVAASVVSDQWQSIDMGTLSLKEITNSAMDYDPFTQVSIYLPFIGFRQLNTVDVMASTLSLIYKIDILTGSCIAQLYVNHNYRNNSNGDFTSWNKNEGFLYSFEGQCAVNLPLSSQDFTNTIRAAISSVGMVAGTAASIATGNPAIGVASLAMGVANTGITANTPVIERSGHLSASQGLLDYMQPFLVVIRPHRCKPQRYYTFRGVPAQTYAKLSNCSGYTTIADGQTLHISGATSQECDEINNLLKSGVYL